jgi:RNA polymerase primary sigma factor
VDELEWTAAYLDRARSAPTVNAVAQTDLAARASTGDAGARSLLLECARPQVVLAAYGFRNNRGSTNVLRAGHSGLERAIGEFRRSTNFSFPTYAGWWIRQSITRAIADDKRRS